MPAKEGLEPMEVVPSYAFYSWRSVRLHVALQMGLACVAAGVVRANLNMAIVCMVNATATPSVAPLPNASLEVVEEGSCSLVDTAEEGYSGPFSWGPRDQALLHSALFWGGFVSGFPSGFLTDCYGSKSLMTGMLVTSVAGSGLSPLVALRSGLVGLAVLRFVIGFSQGVCLPAAAGLLARWHRKTERSTALTLFTMGNQVSVLIAMPAGAALCAQPDGWRLVFYASAALALLLTIPWVLVVSDSPSENRWISEEEKAYIAFHTGAGLASRKDSMRRIPWRRMLTSKPVLGAVISNFSSNLFLNTLFVYLPTYFRDVLAFDLAANGFYSALPCAMIIAAKCVFAPTADALKGRTRLSHTVVSKAFNSIAAFGVAVFLVGMSWGSCSRPWVGVVSLSLASLCFAGYSVGFLATQMSVAPQFTGLVSSISRLSGQSASIIGPYVVGALVTEGSAEEWRLVFLLIAAVCFGAGVAFLVLGSDKQQPWATPAGVPRNPTSQALLEEEAKA